MKNVFLLIILLSVFSCEQYELDDAEKVNSIQTKAENNIADFDPLLEFNEIPVNIINVGNSKLKYLSCEEKSNKVKLVNKDDGSGRQQWLFRYGGITVSKGHSGLSNTIFGTLVPDNFTTVEHNPPSKVVLIKAVRDILSPILPGNWFYTYLDNGNLTMGQFYFYETPRTIYFLSSSSSTSEDLKFVSENNVSDLSQWVVKPVGNFELVDIQYVRTTVDDFDLEVSLADESTVENNSTSTQVLNVSLNTTVTESSQFQNMEGVSTSLNRGVSIGLPNILGLTSSIGINTSLQQQSSHSYTFSEGTQKTITRDWTLTLSVAPQTRLNVQTILYMYKGSLTYVATLRKIGSDETFRVKGTWTGECCSKYIARIYESSTDQYLGEYELEAKK